MTIIAALEMIRNEIKRRYANNLINIFTIKEIPEVICISHFDPLSQSKCSEDDQRETENKVHVDRLCAASILRGAHVYGPGVVSMTSSANENDFINIYTELGKVRLKGSKCDTLITDKDIYLGQGIVRMNRYSLFCSNAKTKYKTIY